MNRQSPIPMASRTAHGKGTLARLWLPSALALLLTPTAFAGDDAALYEVGVTGEASRVYVETVDGVHVNLSAPIELSVKEGDYLRGAEDESVHGGVSWSLPMPLSVGQTVNMNFSLCDDEETWCRITRVAFDYDDGAPIQVARAAKSAGKKGGDVAIMPGHVEYAIQGDLPAAFAKAEENGALVLIDFGAVWCPPCQLLNAEGFTNPGIIDTLKDVVVVQLDADHESSWEGKKRYQVGGYPTMVLTKTDGEEISRMVGYPGVENMQHWLSTNIASGRSGSEWLDMRNGGDRSPEVLLGVARHFTAMDMEEEAAHLYQEALPQLSGLDEMEARYALLVDAARQGDNRGVKAQLKVLTSGNDISLDTVWAVYSAAGAADQGGFDKLTDKLTAAGLKVCESIAASAEVGSDRRADALDGKATFYSAMEDETSAKAAYSEAADAWLAALERQEVVDGNRYTNFRAQARALTGNLRRAERLDEAETIHKELVGVYPEEYTYHHDYARFLMAQDRLDEARSEAELAVKYGYGDNRFVAVGTLAKVMHAQGKTDEAIALLNETVENATRPNDAHNRTHRYIQRLEKQAEKLANPPEAS